MSSGLEVALVELAVAHGGTPMIYSYRKGLSLVTRSRSETSFFSRVREAELDWERGAAQPQRVSKVDVGTTIQSFSGAAA